MMKLQVSILFMMVTLVAASVAGEAVTAELTEKAMVEKYWKEHITNNLPVPTSIVDKASPLTTANSKKYEELAIRESLHDVLSDFCSDAGLFCNADHKFGEAFFYVESQQPHYDAMENETVKVAFTGAFFRENLMKEGTEMMMGEIGDITPERSFLPRSLASKLPFSYSKMGEMKKLWNKLFDEKTLDRMIKYTTNSCQRKPNIYETKICTSSIEDMIDFSTYLLGGNITVRTTRNGNGAKEKILLGHVKAINNGKVTRSLNCHSYLFPYMLYYCHSVPAVRIYDVQVLDPKTKSEINQAIAICHQDTSSWTSDHVAFKELGSGPGKIEVCHWTKHNNLSWMVVAGALG